MTSWKRDFASGLVVLAPVFVTAYIVAWVFNQLARIPIPVDSAALRVALTLTVVVLLIFAVGYLMRTAFGAIFESILDDAMNRVPGLRMVYNASKMAVDTAIGGTDELQAPVKLETWAGLRMTAFKTGKTTADGRDVLFLPTSPNITTGFVIEVEPERYEETDETVEDALTRVLSAGFGDSDDLGPRPLEEILAGRDESEGLEGSDGLDVDETTDDGD